MPPRDLRIVRGVARDLSVVDVHDNPHWSLAANIFSLGVVMIILGIVLLVVGLLVKIPIIWTIGVVVLVIGALLFLAGAIGHQVGGRRHFY